MEHDIFCYDLEDIHLFYIGVNNLKKRKINGILVFVFSVNHLKFLIPESKKKKPNSYFCQLFLNSSKATKYSGITLTSLG